MKIVSIDVGIKNLAYCIMDNSFNIIQWDVINLCGKEIHCNCQLMEKSKNVKNNKKEKKDITINIQEKVEKPCTKKAIYSKDTHYYCKTHAKKQTDYIIPTSQFNIKKIKKMKLVELIELASHYKIEYPIGSKKETILSAIMDSMQFKFLDSIDKQQSANEMNLIDIGIAIRKELDKIPLMMEVDKIIIENQISPIANRMKTIQGMIAQYFIMNDKTTIAFISSANKLKAYTKPLVEGEEKSTYSERKKASVEITLNLLNNNTNNNLGFKDFFTEHKKKDDLADCFLQGLWYLTKQS